MGIKLNLVSILLFLGFAFPVSAQKITVGKTININGIHYQTRVGEVLDVEENIMVYGTSFQYKGKELFGYIRYSTQDNKLYSKGNLQVLGRLILITEHILKDNKRYDVVIRFFDQEPDGNIKPLKTENYYKGALVETYIPPKSDK